MTTNDEKETTMNGPEHFREAERLLASAAEIEPAYIARAGVLASLAAVHATLALASATALPAVWRYCGDESGLEREWAGVA